MSNSAFKFAAAHTLTCKEMEGAIATCEVEEGGAEVALGRVSRGGKEEGKGRTEYLVCVCV